MKVLDLGCSKGHVFEGWFGSETDYQQQRDTGRLTCPVCGDAGVAKRLSAPRLNLGATQPRTAAPNMTVPQRPPAEAASAGLPAELQAVWWQAMRTIAARTEDVGDRFAEEARRIHRGDTPARDIRGRATLEQAQDLLEEGVELLPLPDLDLFKTTLQ